MGIIHGPTFWFICESIIFLAFTVICSLLVIRRFSRKTSCLIMSLFMLGIISLNVILVLFNCPVMQVLSLIALTAYVPMIICIHLLSKPSFFQVVAIWNIGLLGFYILKIVAQIALVFLTTNISGQLLNFAGIITMALVALLSAIIIFVFAKYIQKPFKQYILELRMNWIITLIPLVLIGFLLSYFSWSVNNKIVSVLLFLTPVAVFVVILKMLKSAYEAIKSKENEGNLESQIKMQKQDYEVLCKKIESSREYRHDMRHHVAVLKTLLQQENNNEAIAYIQKLDDKFEQIERKVYCENSTVNAILSFYIGQASSVNCLIDLNVKIPKELSFDDLDICAILSNAIENAVHACEKILDTNKRKILISALYKDEKLVICVENTCFDDIKFDDDGFPIVKMQIDHGIGLKSIKAVVEKYNGAFSCCLNENVFSMKVVVFANENLPELVRKTGKKSAGKIAKTTGYIIVVFCLFLNGAPAVANVLEEIPVIGDVVRIVTLQTSNLRWGDSVLNMTTPKIEIIEQVILKSEEELVAENKLQLGVPINETTPIIAEKEIKDDMTLAKEPLIITTNKDDIPYVLEQPKEPNKGAPDETPDSPVNNPSNPNKPPLGMIKPGAPNGVDEINRQMEEYIKLLRSEFLHYLSMKYQGYTAMDIDYKVICNNESMLSIRIFAIINLGGSSEVSRVFTLDKRANKVIELKDIFIENSDYVGVISAEIIKQATNLANLGEGDYFVPGGIWSDEECFKTIKPEQNFYINSKGNLVIIFDEYVIAPGSMGCPEFEISTDTIKSILL